MEPVKSAPDLERKLVAIFAADVVGFARHMERDEVGTLQSLSGYRSEIDLLVDRYGGRITGSAGDSVMAEFASVIEAVECAVKVQERLYLLNEKLDEDHALMFRIGINVGDVMVKGTDIFGDGVNVAARLEGLSNAGGICVSRGVYDYVDKQTAYVFRDLGEQHIKNIADPIRAYEIVIRGGRAILDEDAFESDDGADADCTSPSDRTALELALWDTVKDSDSADELAAYLDQFPDGTFSDVARLRIEELKR